MNHGINFLNITNVNLRIKKDVLQDTDNKKDQIMMILGDKI